MPAWSASNALQLLPGEVGTNFTDGSTGLGQVRVWANYYYRERPANHGDQYDLLKMQRVPPAPFSTDNGYAPSAVMSFVSAVDDWRTPQLFNYQTFVAPPVGGAKTFGFIYG